MSSHGTGKQAVGVEANWADALEQQFGQMPWWLASSVVHALVLAVLALVVVSSPKEEELIPLDTVFVQPPPEEPPVVQPLVFTPEERRLAEIHGEVEVPGLADEEVEVEDPEIDSPEISRDKGRIDDGEILDMHELATVARIGLGPGGPEGSHGPDPWGRRRQGPEGKRRLGPPGGPPGTGDAVERALRWLARHQEADGHWDAARFSGQNTDVGVTGLAILAFLGAGHDESHRSRYRANVEHGVTWLISRQAADGAVGRGCAGGLGYHHAIAGLALAEAYGMGECERTRVAAQKAVDYSVATHQSPGSGWRYSAGEAADTSVTGWFVMQLKSASMARLDVDTRALQGAAAFLDRCTDRSGHYPGRVSYQPGHNATPAMSAVGLVSRVFMGWGRRDPIVRGAVQHILRNPAAWEGADFYYWYYAMLGLFQVGGQEWKAWGTPACKLLVERQRSGLPDVDGSWDPAGRWCDRGGRVYSTAMGALSLEVFYRYPQVFGAGRVN
jgi:hypothetical protein